jgi:hypothetical protein
MGQKPEELAGGVVGVPNPSGTLKFVMILRGLTLRMLPLISQMRNPRLFHN